MIEKNAQDILISSLKAADKIILPSGRDWFSGKTIWNYENANNPNVLRDPHELPNSKPMPTEYNLAEVNAQKLKTVEERSGRWKLAPKRDQLKRKLQAEKNLRRSRLAAAKQQIEQNLFATAAILLKDNAELPRPWTLH